jgi:oxalate decarboxylase/phosphoglucose isomerase-like protein (cupin superfamily)
MKAGEVLYLPRGWTHRVENVSPALMINTWRYGPAAITEYWSAMNRDELRKKCF